MAEAKAKPTTIFEKLMKARQEFHQKELKKTGQNTYAGYKYFELADFLQPAMDCLAKYHLIPIISFTADEAMMMVVDAQSGESFTILSPMAEANLKGCHPIQNLGAVQTYQRRYLWVTLMEIIESDALDSAEPVKKGKVTPIRKQASPDVTPEWEENFKKASLDDEWGGEPNTIEAMEAGTPDHADEDAAKDSADLLIELATSMHSGSVKDLADCWMKNKKVIDHLDHSWPDQYARVKAAFTNLRKKAEEKK